MKEKLMSNKIISPLKMKNINSASGINMVDYNTAIDNQKGYNNKVDSLSKSLRKNAKAAFINADKIYYAKTGLNIRIRDGSRDVYAQAQYYINYNFLNKGNPAMFPGCSRHNYGLAIDVRIVRKKELKDALINNGWKQTVLPREPWHYEYTLDPSQAKIANKINQLRGGLSSKWHFEISNYYKKINLHTQTKKSVDDEYVKVKSEGQNLQIELNIINKLSKDVKDRKEAFNKFVRNHNAKKNTLLKLNDELKNKRPGPDRDRLINEINKLHNEVKQEKNYITRERNEISKAIASLNKRTDIFNAKVKTFRLRRDKVLKATKALDTLQKEIDNHKVKADTILAQIDKEVKTLK